MPGKMDDSLPNRHALIAGGSGAGKTTYAKKWYAKHARVVFWDPDGSHAARGVTYADNLKAFIRGLATGSRRGRCRLAYAPVQATEEEYQRFCHAIFMVMDCRYPMTVITEELQEVTGSGGAREWHNTLLTRSRKYGLTLCYLSNRPQQIDKTTCAQTEHKVTGQLARRADIDAMAKEMDVTSAEISGLLEANGPEPRKKLHFVERLPGQRAKQVAIALPARRKRRASVAK